MIFSTSALDVLQRFEDTKLDLKPLPAPKLVQTPDGIANELFGDIVMVTEFISCFKGLLMPDDNSHITAGWCDDHCLLFFQLATVYPFLVTLDNFFVINIQFDYILFKFIRFFSVVRLLRPL